MKGSPSRSIGSSSKDQDVEYIQYLPLYKALDNGDWVFAMEFLDQHPTALTATLSADGDTPLHIAVLAGHTYIVEELVSRLDAEDVAIVNNSNDTTLNYAAIGGITSIAVSLVNKNRKLLTTPNRNDHFPVVVASLYGHKEMARYLYAQGPIEELSPERGKNGIMLLTTCILDEIYDIALDLLQHYPNLAFLQDSDEDTALQMLSQKPSAFLGGSDLNPLQRLIYSCICVSQPRAYGNIQADSGPVYRRSTAQQVPAIKHLYNLKQAHSQAHEILVSICQQMSTLHKSEFQVLGIYKALFSAIEYGIVEVVTEMVRHYPEIIWCEDKLERGIFLYATLQRKEKIFSLIYKMGARKNVLATSWDTHQNNILHQAAILPPSSHLDRVSGAALQMQRELQWFKEVESIVQPKYKEMLNNSNKKPEALFTDTHINLVKEGEKWMKATAKSSTVVAALISTIMFSALFTVPGGYDHETGLPTYLNQDLFIVFIVSDALSLFASSSSLLMFLAILTSRYMEEDFLQSLPTKLIIGLSTLFFSIATMMVTFAVTLVITLRERIPWVSFPIILLASLPVTLFALLQFPLLVEVVYSTYGPGIFDKPNKWSRLWFWKKRRFFWKRK